MLLVKGNLQSMMLSELSERHKKGVFFAANIMDIAKYLDEAMPDTYCYYNIYQVLYRLENQGFKRVGNMKLPLQAMFDFCSLSGYDIRQAVTVEENGFEFDLAPYIKRFCGIDL